MRPRSYDRECALALLPLLRAISSEIEERSAEIARLDRLEHDFETKPAREEDLAQLRAELATHRFELRGALKELAGLGCELSIEGPLTIRIPGQDGDLEGGFAWRPGERHLRLLADPAA